jgi:hypothetical protein
MAGPAVRDYHPRMPEPLDRMRRRPLLAPLLLPLLVLLAAGAGIYWLGSWARTTVVVFVRHAEPQPTSGGDPDLSITGERRVAALGGFLADLFVAGKVDHLYAADTRRATDGAPVANQFGFRSSARKQRPADAAAASSPSIAARPWSWSAMQAPCPSCSSTKRHMTSAGRIRLHSSSAEFGQPRCRPHYGVRHHRAPAESQRT